MIAEPYSKGVCSHGIYAAHCPAHGAPHRANCRCQMCGMLKPELCAHGRTRNQDCPHCPGSFQPSQSDAGAK